MRESTDGRSIVATFELPLEVAKPDIHVSFQRNKLVLTWEIGEIEEWMEDGVLNRERTLKHFHRTIPLPEGTRVSTRLRSFAARTYDTLTTILSYPVRRDSRPNDKPRTDFEIPQHAHLSSGTALQIRGFLTVKLFTETGHSPFYESAYVEHATKV